MSCRKKRPQPIAYCATEKECDIYYGQPVFHAAHLDTLNYPAYFCPDCIAAEIAQAIGPEFDKLTYQQQQKTMRSFIAILKFAGFELVRAE